MEEKEVLLTQEGYDNLEKELEYLKTEKRTEISERIKVALGYYLRYCERDIFNNKLYAVILIILSVIFIMIFALFTTGKQSFLELGSIFIILETAGIFILFKNFKTET